MCVGFKLEPIVPSPKSQVYAAPLLLKLVNKIVAGGLQKDVISDLKLLVTPGLKAVPTPTAYIALIVL